MQVIAILYSSFVFCYMPAAGIALDSPISLLFHAFVFLILASYVQVYFTDPGRPPSTEEWQTFGKPPSCLRERKVSAKGSARWCRKSNMYKPDRAHFCKVTDSVVLRMDHHCPWLGNTIGYANHKYFFLVLLYTCATCALVDVNFIILLLQATLPPSSLLVLLESAGVSLLLSSIMLPFFAFHCWLIANNMTTIEFCERKNKAKQREDDRQQQDDDDQTDSASGHDLENMYDIGLFGNCQAVLGHNPLTWLLPIGGPTGDGISFLTADAALEEDAKVVDADDAVSSGSQCEAGAAEADQATKQEEEKTAEEAETAQALGQAAEDAPAWPCWADAAGDILAGCNLLADVSQDAASMIAGIFCGSAPPAVKRPPAQPPATTRKQRRDSQVRTEKRVRVHGLSAGLANVEPKADVVTTFLGEVEAKGARDSVASASTTATVSRLSQSVASTTASTSSFSESEPL